VPSYYTRRQLVGLATAAGATLAGCASPIEPSADGDTDGDADGDTASTPASETDTTDATGTAADELDLREANVVAVDIERRSDAYRFGVTLYHDDDGEDGYANWWQVETLDGERLGRRDLAHAHGTREFTRSATVTVPGDTACVVVRGHDRTHGYGGQAMVVNVKTSATRTRRQGPERRPVTDAEC